jgi:flagellar basal-body rod protein FlgG
MNPALWAAKTGLDAQQTRMSVTAHNLANVNTTGFKKGRAVFEDLLYQNVRQVGASTSQDTLAPTGLSLGTGVRVVATEKTYTQGNLSQTGNSLDMAINGRGFFQVLMPDGTLGYTRDGNFEVNAQGELVTSSGYLVQPSISIPQGAQTISIGKDGVITVQIAGQSAPTQVGSVQIADFINTAGLQPRGENMLLETASSGSPQPGTPGLNGLGFVEQGSLEGSNVNVVEELVDMIETQRAYEMNTKAISTTDQMLEFLTNQIG